MIRTFLATTVIALGFAGSAFAADFSNQVDTTTQINNSQNSLAWRSTAPRPWPARTWPAASKASA